MKTKLSASCLTLALLAPTALGAIGTVPAAKTARVAELARAEDSSLEERLWEASKQGDVDAIRALLEEGADVPRAHRIRRDRALLRRGERPPRGLRRSWRTPSAPSSRIADNFYGNTPIGMAGLARVLAIACGS